MPATASRPDPADQAPVDDLPVDADTVRAKVTGALVRSFSPPERVALAGQFALLGETS